MTIKLVRRKKSEGQKKKGKIVNLLLIAMLIVGTIPLIISGYNLISYNKNILARDQQVSALPHPT